MSLVTDSCGTPSDSDFSTLAQRWRTNCLFIPQVHGEHRPWAKSSSSAGDIMEIVHVVIWERRHLDTLGAHPLEDKENYVGEGPLQSSTVIDFFATFVFSFLLVFMALRVSNYDNLITAFWNIPLEHLLSLNKMSFPMNILIPMLFVGHLFFFF